MPVEVTEEMMERAWRAFEATRQNGWSQTIAEFRENQRECLRAAIAAALLKD